MRTLVGVLISSAVIAALGATAVAATKPRPSDLWSKYPAGKERIESATAKTVPRDPPPRPVVSAPRSTRPPDSDSEAARPVTALATAGLVLLALVLLFGARRRQTRSRPAAPRRNGAPRAQQARGQLTDLLGRVQPPLRIRMPVVARAASRFDTVRSGFPQGRSTVSSEPENPTSQTVRVADEVKADLESRVAGILEAAKQAAEQIRTDARNEAATIRREAEEAAAARSQRAEQEADRMRSQAEREAAEIRQNGEAGATQRRREAEEQARKALGDADAQAKATREAAAEMARRIEHSARAREAALQRETEPLEARLRRALTGLGELSSQLQELVGTPQQPSEEGAAESRDDRRVPSA
jgi:vacuolar-type H+-ATPase subunit E/Vma4